MNLEDMLKFLNFSLNDDKSSYAVSGPYLVKPISIEIPPMYLEKPVTIIDNFAFAGCESLISIVIPNSVTSVGIGAFQDCTSLTIYAEASSKPFGWSNSWNSSNRPVVWGYRG